MVLPWRKSFRCFFLLMWLHETHGIFKSSFHYKRFRVCTPALPRLFRAVRHFIADNWDKFMTQFSQGFAYSNICFCLQKNICVMKFLIFFINIISIFINESFLCKFEFNFWFVIEQSFIESLHQKPPCRSRRKLESEIAQKHNIRTEIGLVDVGRRDENKEGKS